MQWLSCNTVSISDHPRDGWSAMLRRIVREWSRIVGTSADSHYGRPFAFHVQAHRANWSGAWSRVRAPVLVLYGEYDWFESSDAASLIERIVNAQSPGRAKYVTVPSMNHHFEIFQNPGDAFREQNGRVDPDPAVAPMLEWLKTVGRPAS